jgi:glycine cleavage system H protein
MTDATHVAQLERLPGDRLYAALQDLWVRFEDDGTATLGMVHLMAVHVQFLLFTPRPAGSPVAFDRSLGVMETAKSAVAIHAPLSCRIVEANVALERDIGLLTRDPYGAGWLLRVQPTGCDAERERLIDVTAYRAWLASRMDRFDPPPPASGDAAEPAQWP